MNNEQTTKYCETCEKDILISKWAVKIGTSKLKKQCSEECLEKYKAKKTAEYNVKLKISRKERKEKEWYILREKNIKDNFSADKTKIYSKNTNHIIKVSPSDFEMLADYRWSVVYKRSGHKKHAYAVGVALNSHNPAPCKNFLMHRYLMAFPRRGKVVDHMNRNGVDNRRENLRVVGHSENMLNSDLSRMNTTGAKGVTARYNTKGDKYYLVQWTENGVQKHSSKIEKLEQAARYYDNKIANFYGKVRVTNKDLGVY